VLVSSLSFGFLLTVGELPLGSLVVAAIDVLNMLWVGVFPDVTFNLLLLLVDGIRQLIKTTESIPDLLLKDLCDCRLHNAHQDRLEESEEDLVVGLF